MVVSARLPLAQPPLTVVKRLFWGGKVQQWHVCFVWGNEAQDHIDSPKQQLPASPRLLG